MKYKIFPLFLPHLGCPHQCVFCDQKAITGNDFRISIQKIRQQIVDFGSESFSDYREQVHKEVAFYGSSFTAIPEPLQRDLLSMAKGAIEKKQIDGIRISTRPDYCDFKAIHLLREYQVRTVELGVQSMDPEVLLRAGRGHGPEKSIQALKALKYGGFITGAQLMPGLPGEDRDSFLSTIQQIIALKPDFVRLYPTIVIKGTSLERLFLKGEYQPLSLTQAVNLCRDGTMRLRKSGIRVIRCGLQTTPSLDRGGLISAGPFHPAFGELVESAIVFNQLNQMIKKMMQSSHIGESILIQAPPRRFSILKGQKSENLFRLKLLYPDVKIFMEQNLDLCDDIIRVKSKEGTYIDIPNDETYQSRLNDFTKSF